MTAMLEAIVRPFQTRRVTYPTRIIDHTIPPVADIVVLIGQSGVTKTFNESFSENTTSYTEVTSKEKSRTTENKHITNPSDSSQFVDVQLIKKLAMEQGQGRTYQQINYSFNNN